MASPLLTNLVAYYKMDESGGSTMVDATGNYNGSTGGATLNQATGRSRTGTCFYLNHLSSSTKVTLPASSAFAFGTGNFSIAFWVKGNFSTAFGTALIGSDGSYGANSSCIKWDWSSAGASYAQRITIAVENATNTGRGDLRNGNALLADTWYHIVFVRNGDTMSCYTNGTLTNTASGWSGYNANFYRGTSNPTLGWWQADSGDTDLQVYVDELGFWNRALMLTEITKLHNGGNGNSYPFVSPAAIARRRLLARR